MGARGGDPPNPQELFVKRRRARGGLAVTSGALAVVLATATSAAAAPSATSVTASPASAVVGSPVQLTATVSCASDPSGGIGVSFFDGSTPLPTVPVGANGQASYTTSFTTVGTHTITAAYNGNGNCDASNSTTTVQVSSSPTPPPPPPSPGLPGLCMLTCGSLIGFLTGDRGPADWFAGCHPHRPRPDHH
ncbi:Ig-like domain-containing protein [Streptomyces flaveolus]|uniref:Ig-like domain-containing protein n=1 Tax=Streptomyces flaveolus TaxID=67297 RepID=UPI0033A6DB9B